MRTHTVDDSVFTVCYVPIGVGSVVEGGCPGRGDGPYVQHETPKRISYIHSKVFPEKTLQDRVYDVYPAFLTAFRLFEQTHIRL